MVPVASLFAQALSLISRHDFAKAVRQRGTEKAAKGFSCWDQFVAMLPILRNDHHVMFALPPYVG